MEPCYKAPSFFVKARAAFAGCFLSEVTGVTERSTFTLLHLAEPLARLWNRIRCYTLVLRLKSLKGKGVCLPSFKIPELKNNFCCCSASVYSFCLPKSSCHNVHTVLHQVSHFFNPMLGVTWGGLWGDHFSCSPTACQQRVLQQGLASF